MSKSYIVDTSYEGIRIDKWIRNNLGKVPQGLIEKSLRAGKIKLNKKKIKSSTKLNFKDIINVYDIEFKEKFIEKKINFIPSNEVIKENENLIIDNNENFIVVNKESGIAVQGGTKSKKNLIDIFSKSKIFENSKPYSVHRLDKDTSGVFIIAKNRNTAKLFTSLFRLRKIHKSYLSVCHGELNSTSGELIHNLERYENNKIFREKAITKYKVIDRNLGFSLVQLNPLTGRKHQLRKQLFIRGFPIIGDQKYQFKQNKRFIDQSMLLHSFKIKFIKNNKKFNFKAEPDIEFKKKLNLYFR